MSHPVSERKSSGFTIIELAVALLISAIMATMAYQAIDQAARNRGSIDNNTQRLQELQNTMRLLVQDIAQTAPRPVRESAGASHRPAIQGTATEFELTRAGWSNPAGVQRSQLQRVRYVLEEETLVRLQWSTLDALLDPPPLRRELLKKVKSISIRYMNDAYSWQGQWPPPAPGGAVNSSWLRWRPLAIEVTIELDDWGRLSRLVEIAG